MSLPDANDPLPIRPPDVMVDLETFGTERDAVVVSIGAVKMIPGHTLAASPRYYAVLDAKEQHQKGRVCDPDTVRWWLEQGGSAREAIGQQYAKGPYAVLADLHRFMRGIGYVWAKPASFDLVILRSLFKTFGMVCPWDRYQERCFRTAVGMSLAPEPKRIGDAHNALHDAEHQARWLLSMPEYR